MQLLPIITLLFLAANTQLSLQFNPDDDYYETPKYNEDVLQPAPIFLGKDDSGCICREVPKSHTLCFGRNACDKLPIKIKINTEVLSLISTHIPEIKEDDLIEYAFLKDLKIEGNYNLTKISGGVFSNFSKLENLSISFNPILRVLNKDTFVGLVSLKQLFLIKNGFTSVYNIAITLSPNVVPKLLKLSLNENKFVTISENDFSPMQNSTLEELDLMLCRLEYLYPKSLAPLINLEALRIGENIFNASTISEVLLETVRRKIPLKLLNLYSAGFRAKLPKELIDVISISNISHLNLARNQFEYIPSGVFPLMPNLRSLDLKGDLISDIADDAFDNLTNLESLTLSDNIFVSLPKGALLKQLKKLDFQQNSLYSTKTSYFEFAGGSFEEMSNLEILNLNSNNIAHLFTSSFIGLNNLKRLSLRNCTIYHIENQTFAPLRNLKYLNLENNHFIVNAPPDGIPGDFFNGLEQLEVLLLGGNDIKFLSKKGDAFSALKSLKTLGLDRNSLTYFNPVLFHPLTKLEFIDLSFNLLKSWDKRLFVYNNLKVLDLHHNKITYLTVSMLEDFSNLTGLTITYNPLKCNCINYNNFNEFSRKYDVMKILQSNENTCLTPDISTNLIIYNIVDFIKAVDKGLINCDINNFVTLLPLVLLFILFVLLGLLSFCYRWHIKYWMFLARLHLSRNGKILPKHTNKSKCNFEYDAFVSYSAEDRNFVVRLVAMLENNEPYLKLCVYERDFHAGGFISDCVLKCIAKSRRIVLIVSDNYAKSQWCRWESSIAENHRIFFEKEDGEVVDDAIVIIKLGPVSKRNMTPMLRFLMKTRIYLEWHADEKKQLLFWKKLRATLAPPKTDFVAEITHM